MTPERSAGQKEYPLTDIHELLGQIPVDQIATLLGTDTATAQAAVEAAVPTLLAGMQNNAQAPGGAASLESALAQHRNGPADGGVDATQVNTDDGEKIVSHVFGGQQDQVANQLAGAANLGGGVGGDLVRKLLPILAPIVMSYLAKKILGGAQQGAGRSPLPGGEASGGAGGIDLGSILGGILGGAAGAGGPGQGGLGDILGGILGGGRQQQSQPNPVPASDQPEPTQPPEPVQRAEPATGTEGEPAQRSVTPGEVIDVDLPGEDQPDQSTSGQPSTNNDGGLGGILGDLFGKK